MVMMVMMFAAWSFHSQANHVKCISGLDLFSCVSFLFSVPFFFFFFLDRERERGGGGGGGGEREGA